MTERTNDGYYEAHWPRSPRQQRVRPLASRLKDLEGRTVAQLWDQLFKGDVVFELLEEGLRRRYPGIRFVSWREFGSTHGGEETAVLSGLPQRLRAFGVDAVISGMAC